MARIPLFERYKAKIQALMAEKGLTQTELARQIDIPRTTLTFILNGRVNPTILEAKKIAEFLGVALEEIFPSSNEKFAYTGPTVTTASIIDPGATTVDLGGTVFEVRAEKRDKP